MENYRTPMRVLTGLLIAAEAYIVFGSEWAQETEELFNQGDIFNSIFTVLFSIAVLIVISLFVVYGIIFKCVYFRAGLSSEEIKTEGTWSGNMAMIATAVSFTIMWIVVLVL